MRRALHNQIQELRGNVRVFCRVRPSTSTLQCAELGQDGRGLHSFPLELNLSDSRTQS